MINSYPSPVQKQADVSRERRESSDLTRWKGKEKPTRTAPHRPCVLASRLSCGVRVEEGRSSPATHGSVHLFLRFFLSLVLAAERTPRVALAGECSRASKLPWLSFLPLPRRPPEEGAEVGTWSPTQGPLGHRLKTSPERFRRDQFHAGGPAPIPSISCQ